MPFIAKQEALSHPVRAPLLERVRSEPGITLSELARAFEVTPSTVLWHARKLSDAGMLRMEIWGRKRLFFSSEAGSHGRAEALRREALRRPHAVAALRLLAAQPGLSTSDVARLLGAPEPAVRRSLAQLRQAGWVRSVCGERVLHFVAEAPPPVVRLTVAERL